MKRTKRTLGPRKLSSKILGRQEKQPKQGSCRSARSASHPRIAMLATLYGGLALPASQSSAALTPKEHARGRGLWTSDTTGEGEDGGEGGGEN